MSKHVWYSTGDFSSKNLFAMIQTLAVHKTVKGVFEVLLNHGIAVLPSKLGYGILALSDQGIEKMYQLKNRPAAKPSGVLATPKIFSELTASKFKRDVLRLQHPVGLIECPDFDHPMIESLPHIAKQNGTIAFFMNMDKFMTQLCEYAWQRGRLITISSANKAGTGNCLRFADLHQDFKLAADYIREEDDLSLYHQRGKIDNITSTIIDLPRRKVFREGVYAARIKAFGVEKYMITDHLPTVEPTFDKTANFRSCIFLQAFKESTYERMANIRDTDWLALDFEDGCPADMKPRARQLVEQHAHRATFDHQFIVVRLNELDKQEELALDLQVKYTSKVRAFALPMLRSAADVDAYDKLITQLEKRLGLPSPTFQFFPIIETPEALNNAEAIAKASPRNIAMFLGHADLFGELHSQRNMLNLHTVRMLYLSAARAGGLYAFDTPFEDVKNIPGLEKDAYDSMQMGLDGKVALNFEQLEKINTIFGLSSEKKIKYEHILRQYKGGCQIIDGEFVAPPIIKKIKTTLKKRVYKPMRTKVSSTRGKALSYGLDFRNAFPGQIITSPYEATIDESWITSWQAMVQTGNPLETSLHFCESAGLKGRLAPFQMLVNLGLCLVVETFSESSLFHLGISNVVYERPVYSGDTLRSAMIIDDIVPSSNQKYTIFKTRMVLINQNNQRVISMNRNSLFPYIDPVNIPTSRVQYKHRYYSLFEQETYPFLRHSLFKVFQTLDNPILEQQPELATGDLILHSLTRPMGLSNSIAYSTLYKNTHPLHINSARYGMEGLVVCGGFIIPMIHGAASRDIRFALDHEIVDTMHINKIHHEDAIGAMSYILDVKEVKEDIECITIRTFGLKNLDAERDLINSEIPDDLLASPKIKPREIELLCKTYCPELHHKICARMTWRMWRRK
jgi:citrate lyase subunit beta/citryl-CoA lyase